MAGWVQVVLFVACLVSIVGAAVIVYWYCRRQQHSVMMTRSTVIVTITGLIFPVLYFMPDFLPVLGVPTAAGMALIAIDVVLLVVTASYCIIIDRNSEIREYLKSLMPPDS